MTALDLVIARAEHAEARVRNVQIVIATLFALIFLFQVSQLNNSWSVVRYELTQRAELYLLCNDKGGSKPSAETCRPTETFDEKMRDFALTYGVVQHAVDARKKLQDVYFENVLRFNIPPLGISIDANDLGPFAGFGFSALYLWLSSCLRVQAQAMAALVRLLSSNASVHEDVEAWKLAFTLLPHSVVDAVTGGSSLPDRWWRPALYGLACAPFALVAWITAYNAYYLSQWYRVVEFQVRLTTILGAIATLVLAVTTLVVLVQIRKAPAHIQIGLGSDSLGSSSADRP